MLTTTRTVRRRLDFSRPVSLDTIAECIELAVQAPSAKNHQGWSWIVVSDPEIRRQMGDIYRAAYWSYRVIAAQNRAVYADDDLRGVQRQDVVSTSDYLAGCIEQAPVLVLICVEGRPEGMNNSDLAALYGTVMPAAWSFMLALRSRNLATAWTTIHIREEEKMAALLGLPPNTTQGVLLPVAHFTGEDFRPGRRRPMEEVVHWNGWGGRRS
ncbi:MAG: nitroreductase family protein [Dehalococcoidia bacterium]